MDFKIGDEIEEVGNEETTSKLRIKSKLPIIIVVILSLLVGFGVFFFSTKLFGDNKPKEPITRQRLALNETNVEILYSYITDEVDNKTREIFVKNSKVTLETFTNQEKFDCALQFAEPEDFEFDGKYKENEITTIKQKIYVIPESKIRKYMVRFFGNKVTYKKDEEINHLFNFQINGNNYGTLKYSNKENGYETTFDRVNSPAIIKEIDDYYTELIDAYKELDGTYTLEEKVIYPVAERTDMDNYTLTIYKDYEHKKMIEKKSNVTKEDLKKIDVKNYKSQAATITYKFALNGNVLYFESSSIKN